MHGAYDDPVDCGQTLSPGAPPGHVRTLEQALRTEGFRPFLVDYGATSGNAAPSAPIENAQRIWIGNGGIFEAVSALRKQGFAATRADLVRHGLGGVLALLNVAKIRGATETSYRSTDVNRLVTIGSTHLGSEGMGLFAAYDAYQTSSGPGRRGAVGSRRRTACGSPQRHARRNAPAPTRAREALERVRARAISALRQVVFDGPNDCTVSEASAKGRLEPPYATTLKGVLHGFAPQYPAVQARVLELLRTTGDIGFAPDGFPDAYR